MTILQEEKVTRVLPPLVLTPEINERTEEIVSKIVKKVLPAAKPGRLSATSSKEIENSIDVCAFVLCWYIAAIRDPIRRDLLAEHFSDKVFTIVCAVEAAAISIAEGISFSEALRRGPEGLGIENVKGAAKRDGQASAAVKRPRNRRSRLRSRHEETALQNEVNPTTSEMPSRRLPPLAIWPYTRKGLAKQVARLLSDIDGETTPGNISTTSDESIEELARASHLALCWFLGCLVDVNKQDKIALQWVEDVPRLVGLTNAIATSEQTGVTVRQALQKKIAGETCIQCWMQTETREYRVRRKFNRKWTEWLGRPTSCKTSAR